MKFIAPLSLLITILLFSENKLAAQSILNPTDTIVEYDASNPPVEPVFGIIGKWVRTKSVSWNSDSYKAYIYESSCFRLKFPKSYNPAINDGKKYPIALVFHGGGEAGPLKDNETQLYHGGLEYRNAVDQGNFDGYVLYMQSQGFWGMTSYQKLIDIIKYMIVNNKVDPFRITVNGLSSGGQASWEMLLNYPNYVGASLPMSMVSIGYKDASVVNAVKFSPMWNFQGQLDGTPAPSTAQQVRDAMFSAGADYKYSEYADVGHNTWDSAFSEPDFFPFLLRAYSSNPWALFGDTGFCSTSNINVTIGLPSGFNNYQWRKNGVVINGATTNIIHATTLGTYDARVLRDTTWSDWSHIPVVLKITPPTVAPPIQVEGFMSNVIPDAGGKNYVNLSIKDSGYTSFAWKKVGSDSIVGTQRIYTATQPGQYIVGVTQPKGCSSVYSQPFTVGNANGLNTPPPATNLTANAVSNTQVSLNWENNPHPVYNETAFEVYRSTNEFGAYDFVGKTSADILTFTDNQASPGSNYFYAIRAVTTNGASSLSNIANTLTPKDTIAPTAPDKLQVIYATPSSIKIQWNSSTDNVSVHQYDIYINGSKTYTTTDTFFIANALTKGINYIFYVKAIDSSGNISAQSNLVNSTATFNGLIAKYYEGFWETMPDFNTLTPLTTTVVPVVNINTSRREAQIAFLWEGFIRIPVTGTYTFQTTSDDGSMVWLNSYNPSATPLINNDGARTSPITKKATIVLNKGVYPISIAYFNLKNSRSMNLSWKSAKLFGDAEFHKITAGYFADSSETQDSIPNRPTNPGATSLSYSSIKLKWADNSDNETGFQIYRSLLKNGTFKIIYTTAANVTQFIDSNLQGSTAYFYKVNAVNNYGTSTYTGVTADTTFKLPASPNAPAKLKAIALSSSSISISWNDIDTDEINYEVLRSVSDSIHFKTAAILPANSTKFIDTSLYGNLIYFYKVNAVNIKSSSINLPPVSAITKNNPPIIQNTFTKQTLPYGQKSSVIINSIDPDGDVLTYSALNMPPFASLVNNGNGTASFNCNASAAQAGTYNNLKIIVRDTHGGSDTNIFNLTINNNYIPVINAISDYTINEGDMFTILLSGSDQNAADSLRWVATGLPAHYSIVSVNKTSAKLVINPGYTATGIYPVNIKANDGNGGINNVQFTLTVNDKDPNQVIYLRFKDIDAIGAPWNNITSTNTTNLTDNLNRPTSVGLTMQQGWFSTWHEGASSGNNSGIYPDAVLKDYYYFGIFGGPETVTNSITGLDTSKLYNVSFLSSSNYSQVPNNGSTIFTVGSQSQSIQVQNNINNTAEFGNLKPAANGTISFTMSKGANTTAGYLNAIVIKALFNDSLKPAAPTFLVAKNVAGKGVQLNWNDVAYNESRYQMYRSVNPTTKYKLISDSISFNSTSYFDSTAEGNTIYYYRVKAYNSQNISSDASNTATVTTTDKVPVITNIADVMMRNDQQKIITVIAKDDASDHVVLAASNLPAFATFTDNGNSTGTINIQPLNGVTGSFNNIVISATDNSDSTSSISFNLTVTDKNVNSVYINFSDGSIASGSWNNFTSQPLAGTILSNLIDDNNTATSISLKLINGFQSQFATGMQPVSGQNIYPATVIKTGEYESSSKIDSLLISGLSTAKKYNFVFFNSHDDGSNGNTNFEINGQVVSLNATQNSNKTIQINNISPNTSGQVIIKISKGTDALNAYINSLVIQSYDPAQTLLSPSDLRVVNVSRNTVGLQWADRGFSETGFEIWRAEDSLNTYSLIQTVAGNVTSYKDSGLYSNKTYYYVVRAVKNASKSDYSNAVAATTYGQAVYVNFDYNYIARAPWNNTRALPENGDSWSNLFDDTNVPSSISMQITGNFAGIYNAGMNTGNNSGIYPDSVLVESYGLFAGQSSAIKISGLNLNKKYDFTFLASSQAFGDINVAYTINGVRAILNASLNINGTVTIFNVVPDENGNVIITLSPATQTSQLGLINALVIQEYTASTTAIPAPSQMAKAVNNISTSSIVNQSKSMDNEIINNLKAYPNPFESNFNISFKMEKKDDIIIQLYDAKGVQVYQNKYANQLQGINTINIIPGENAKPGMYILKILSVSSGKTATIHILKR